MKYLQVSIVHFCFKKSQTSQLFGHFARLRHFKTFARAFLLFFRANRPVLPGIHVEHVGGRLNEISKVLITIKGIPVFAAHCCHKIHEWILVGSHDDCSGLGCSFAAVTHEGRFLFENAISLKILIRKYCFCPKCHTPIQVHFASFQARSDQVIWIFRHEEDRHVEVWNVVVVVLDDVLSKFAGSCVQNAGCQILFVGQSYHS